MACATRGTPLVVNKTRVQISYGHKTTHAHEGPLVVDGLRYSSQSPEMRGYATPNRQLNTAGSTQAWTEVPATRNNTSQTRPVILYARDRERSSEHTDNTALEENPDNATCWLDMVTSSGHDRVAVVSLNKSSCTPGNFVTIRGETYRYLWMKKITQERTTWTGCEGPQDPLGDFRGNEINVGITVTNFDMEYHITVEFTSYYYRRAPKIHLQLNSYNFTKTFGEYLRSYISVRWLLLVDEKKAIKSPQLSGLKVHESVPCFDHKPSTELLATRKFDCPSF